MNAPVSYHLDKFPPESLEWERLIPLLGPAGAAIARYDGLLSAIPNASVLLSPLVTQEAVLSSAIEGTQATMSEVLEVEAGGEPAGLTEPRRGDIFEVINYRAAMNECVKALATRPLSQHMLRQAHEILMRGVRGQRKTPGSHRVDQNWIGPHGCRIDEAEFIPIPPEHLQSGMDQWEAFLNSTQPDALVQLAILHVEFEALHPFRDGNGRLGRMLIPLFLFAKKQLSGPNFYVSGYFETRREEYIDRLRAVSRDDNWTDWCVFFLHALIAQATDNEGKAREILSLYNEVKRKIVDLTHSQHAIRAVDFLFKTPIFNGRNFKAEAEMPRPTATRILNLLHSAGIVKLVRSAQGRQPAIHSFPALLNIAEGRSVF